VMEGDRRCLFMYDAEEWDRGNLGLPVTGDRGGSSLYEEVLLMAGVLLREEAGDCCVGGVYGIVMSTWGGSEELIGGEDRYRKRCINDAASVSTLID
jgi:hypothetical protein